MTALHFDAMEPEALRAFALQAWRRAEAGERAARAAARQQAEAERRAEELATENAELEVKVEALDGEVSVLLKRISELTKELAKARNRDEQLELDLELNRLQERLAELNQEKFGSSRSERRGRPDGSPPKKKRKPKPQRGHGPTDQPELPITEVHHHLDKADCICPKCAGDLRVMAEQFEETELISAVRVRYVLEKHKQQKYRCGGCGHIEAALGPLRLIPGGRYDLAFAVQVAASKYLDHLPVERQVDRMARRGLNVASQTLWDQLVALYFLLLPTWLELRKQLLAEPLLHVDETRWRLMGQGGKHRSAKWWLWTLVGVTGVVYDILPTRGADSARSLLGDYDGILVADAYGVYISLERALDRQGGRQVDLQTGQPEVLPNYQLACCWMHARRPLHKAEKSVPEVGHALDLIGKLFAVEARAREAADGDAEALLEHRRRLRDTESRDIIAELKLWRDAQRPLPGTKHAKGVGFLKNQWPRLIRFLDDARIPLDNGEAERKIRGPVLGRKNFGGCQSVRGTRVAALMYSLLATAKHVGVNPHDYLMAVATKARQESGAVLLPADYAAELAAKD